MPRVIMDRPYTYEIDGGRWRTIPAGWRGEVEPKVAKAIKKAGLGRVIGGAAKKAEGGGAAKKAEGGGDGQGGVGE